MCLAGRCVEHRRGASLAAFHARKRLRIHRPERAVVHQNQKPLRDIQCGFCPLIIVAVERLFARIFLAPVKEVVAYASGSFHQGASIRRRLIGKIQVALLEVRLASSVEVFHFANARMIDNQAAMVAFTRLTTGSYTMFGAEVELEQIRNRLGTDRLKQNATQEGLWKDRGRRSAPTIEQEYDQAIRRDRKTGLQI